jgi:hypothetical protein
MNRFADSIFNALDLCLDNLGSAIIQHEAVLDSYVDMFKDTRTRELQEIKNRRRLGATYYPGLLLVVLKKTRSISQKKHVKSDYDEVAGKKLNFSQLYLGIATRGFTDFIPTESQGKYCKSRVLRFNNLRAYCDEDKEWVRKVVCDVNSLNESGLQLRDAYLELVENHYTALKRYDLSAMQRQVFPEHDNAGFE